MMRYLITGHTGFKGSWLTLWLTSQGHEVYGLSLDPDPGSLFELAHVGELCAVDQRADIRDQTEVLAAVRNADPEIVIHMAAQPLVLDSYKRPRWTLETNVMGTYNLLESVGLQENVKGLLVVTTDKVYRNDGQKSGYTESDPLGGNDPYSASKAMADILTQSWAMSFPGTKTAVARAGNVIGGGDVSPNRLLPDIVSCLRTGEIPVLRHPEAVRPWQHVLDCLNGYRTLIDKLIIGDEDFNFGGGWNFGPNAESCISVGELTTRAMQSWGSVAEWQLSRGDKPHESTTLSLDSSRVETELHWHVALTVDDALSWTLDWFKEFDSGSNARDITLGQIEKFSVLSEKE